jgi:hypothetical protein
MVGAIMLSVFFNFAIPPIIHGGDEIIALLVSVAAMAIFTLVINKLKVKWLREYALSFSMIIAMAVIVIANL